MKNRIHQNRHINAKYLLQLYNKLMARTKQTARKAFVSKAPRKMLKKVKAPKNARNRANQQSSSESQIQDNINTQQFSIRFDDQEKCEKQCVEGKLVYCKDCNAILTFQSEILSKAKYDEMKKKLQLSDAQKQKYLTDTYQQVWICQFCRTHNSIEKNYKPPKQQNPCFLLQKASIKKSKSKIEQGDEKMLIFCIDISGSMDFIGVGKKSRLQSVKEAICDEISRMNFQKEKYRVGLITFGSYVNLIGDGKVFKEKVLETALYHSFQNIVKQTGKINNFCQPITKSFLVLKNRVKDLATYGSTALGPGLLSAIELASKGPMGSKVIICTDGQANVGIGGSFNVDRFTFYNQAAEYAKKKKVMVSILSLKGDRCNLKQLGKLSLATRGSVMKIDPAALGTEFSKITQQEILGSQSKLCIKLNKIFQFVNAHAEKPQDLSKDLTSLNQDYGNFTAQTELTFQFAVLDKEQAVKNPAIDMDLYKQARVPMQIQLEYTGRDGSKFLQVITDWRQLTDDEKAIYQGANFGLFAASVLQRASRKIKNQQFKDAEALIKGYWSIVNEKFSKTEPENQLNKFKTRVEKIQKVLYSKMKKADAKTGVKAKTAKLSKSPEKKEKQSRSRSRQIRGRGRGGKNVKGASNSSVSRSRSRDRDRDRSISAMSSDSQEQVLYREMQARSRSISPKGRGKGKRK